MILTQNLNLMAENFLLMNNNIFFVVALNNNTFMAFVL